jgi:hypothetical protein
VGSGERVGLEARKYGGSKYGGVLWSVLNASKVIKFQ